jgi:hypothetical protein
VQVPLTLAGHDGADDEVGHILAVKHILSAVLAQRFESLLNLMSLSVVLSQDLHRAHGHVVHFLQIAQNLDLKKRGKSRHFYLLAAFLTSFFFLSHNACDHKDFATVTPKHSFSLS